MAQRSVLFETGAMCQCGSSVGLRIQSVMCYTDSKSPWVKTVFLGCINKIDLTCVCVCVCGKRERLPSGFLDMSLWCTLLLSISLDFLFLFGSDNHSVASPLVEWRCVGVCVCRWHCWLSWCWHSRCPWARPVPEAVTATRPAKFTVPFVPCSPYLLACLHTHAA